MPEILAPAGDQDCFLAALAAGANGIYLGLKNFSARMNAHNFSLTELGRLIPLAHSSGCKVYVAMNSLLKQSELEQAYRLLRRLATQIQPDGLIIQDLGMLALCGMADFKGSLILSTLANVTSPSGLATARALHACRVVLPRELSIEEMRSMGTDRPAGLDLECFVHGALCYCVSGRCYWSSYLGGSSGLRGRCVQPCRRNYSRNDAQAKNNGQRAFSCQDLELAPVVKTLFSIPGLASWKIEGRKKGPHYVFHTVTAYKILRDEFANAAQKKMAFGILEMALGRSGSRALFLPHKKYKPMAPEKQTGSGKLIGKIQFNQKGVGFIKPYLPLLPNDLLRVGTQDENWHTLIKVKRHAPKGCEFIITTPRHKTPKAGTAVYLVDRRESELERLLDIWRKKLELIPEIKIQPVANAPSFRKSRQKCAVLPDQDVREKPLPGMRASNQTLSAKAMQAVWLNKVNAGISKSVMARLNYWLPPAIWPENEKSFLELIARVMANGCRSFTLNSPWQRGLFPNILPDGLTLTAGPFCNIANSLACEKLLELGFAGAFISPELNREDFLALPAASPLPLGVVLGGFWPVGISRFGLAGLNTDDVFQSPRGERFWSKDRSGLTWIYPAWPLNLADKKKELLKAGYKFFCWLNETTPQKLAPQKRPGLFNWEGNLI